MLRKFEMVLKRENLVAPKEKIILGVSGGPDSMTMLDLFLRIRKSWQIEIVVVHVHHGLRGQSADEDAERVKKVCKLNKIPFYLKAFDVKTLAKEQGLSFEETGRNIRYQTFETCRRENNGQKIAVAHNQNDQAETILMRIMRGTGLDGLGGMSFFRKPYIIRPLLDFSRKDIERYCEKNNLCVGIDLTNDDLDYTRNRIRHLLVPCIEKHFNPRVVEGLAERASILRSDANFINWHVQELFKKAPVTKKSGVHTLPLSFFKNLHASLQTRFLRKIIVQNGRGLRDVSWIQISQLRDILTSGGHGAQKNIGGVSFEISYENVVWRKEDGLQNVVEKETVRTENLSVSKKMIKDMSSSEKSEILKEDFCEMIDWNSVKGQIKVRYRQPGDKFSPLGMTGDKKLKDFFIDKKIPRLNRDNIPLVCDEKGIIWVVGYRIDNRVKVTEHTKIIGVLSWLKGC